MEAGVGILSKYLRRWLLYKAIKQVRMCAALNDYAELGTYVDRFEERAVGRAKYVESGKRDGSPFIRSLVIL